MKDSLATYSSIRPYVIKEISAVTQHADAASQYRMASTSNHSHNGLDAPQVPIVNILNIQYHSVISITTLTPAQVLLLHTTPIQLVPQPGIRSVVIVDGITARIVYSGHAYSGANNLEFRYTNGSGTKVTADIPSTFIDSTSSAYAHAPIVTAEFAPIEGGSSNNGRIVVCVPSADPGVDGKANLTTTGALSLGATSATLTGNWTFSTGKVSATFSNGNNRLVNVTNGSTAITWNPGLSSGATTAISFLGYIGSVITIVTKYHLVSFQT